MRRPLSFSFALHLAVILLLFVVMPAWQDKPVVLDEPLTVELATIGETGGKAPPALAEKPADAGAAAKAEKQVEAPKAEAAPRPAPVAKPDAPKVEVPKPEPPKPEARKPEPPKPEAPKPEPVKAEPKSKPPPPPPPPEPVKVAERKPEPPAPKPAKPAPAETKPAEEKPAAEPVKTPTPKPKAEPPKPAPPKPVEKAEKPDKPAPAEKVEKAEKPEPPAKKPEPAAAERPTQTAKAETKPAKAADDDDFASVTKTVKDMKPAPAAGDGRATAKPQQTAADSRGGESLADQVKGALRPPASGASAAAGASQAAAGPVTASEIDGVRRQIEQCWNLPAGLKGTADMVVSIRVEMNIDGRPRSAVIENAARMDSDPAYRATAESAKRAVLNPRCQPFKLPPEKYERWRTLTLVFNPAEMFRT